MIRSTWSKYGNVRRYQEATAGFHGPGAGFMLAIIALPPMKFAIMPQ